MLELIVKVININLPASHPILKKCRPLYEYSCFIQIIRDYVKDGNGRDEAIIHAMSDCRQEGLLTDFLNEHGTEAVNMLFTEFNMEDALEVRYEEGQQKGIQQGLQTGIQQGLQIGVQQGQQFVLRLMNAMLADGRADELSKLQSDPAFMKEMMTHYHIEAENK